MLKLALLIRGAGLRLRTDEWVTAAGAVAAVFVLPVGLRLAGESGRLSDATSWAMWWLLAVVVAGAAHALIARRGARRAGGLHLMTMVIPTCSLAVHVFAAHWVFDTAITPAHLTPVLLGLSVALLVGSERGLLPARLWAGACGALAWVLAATSGVAWDTGLAGTLMPAHVFCGVATVAYGAVWLQQRTLGLLGTVIALGVAGLLGATPAEVVERFAGGGQWISRQSAAWWPRTLQAWGVLLVTLAFATLILGGCRVMRRRVGTP